MTFLLLLMHEVLSDQTFNLFQFLKVHIFREGHKILRNLFFLVLTTVLQSKVRGRFRKILWRSQNI